MNQLTLAPLFAVFFTSCDRVDSDSTTEQERDDGVMGSSSLGLLGVDPDEMACGPDKLITESNISVLDTAKIYQKHSGKRVIMANEVAEKTVSLTLGGPPTNGELAKFLQLTLLAEGFAINPIPGEEGIVRIVDSKPINMSGSLPPRPLFTHEDELPNRDDIIMFVMTFENLSPERALEVFQSELGPQTEAGTITAVPNQSSLIITESVPLIRKMIEMKKRMDVPASEVD